MIQIQSQNAIFSQIANNQKPTGDTCYRLLVYSLLQPTDNGMLIYNTLSCELLLLEGDEAEHLLDMEYLREHWFVVPEGFDDKKFMQQFRSLYKLFRPKPHGISNYTILTTTDCNARCFYCYEKGRSRIPMTIATADKLVDYIVGNHRKLLESDTKAKVGLHWFGGEPLYNNKVIYHICQRLTESGVEFCSYMISNGYLFTPQMIEDAKNLWHLKRVQITLDGTESTYNRSKAYIHDDPSPYQRVLNNIRSLLDARIRVALRLNIDMYNADDLIELVNQLHQRFEGVKGLAVYSHPLFEIAGDTLRERTANNRRVVFEKQKKLEELIVGYGLKYYSPVAKEVTVVQCMADNDSSVVVVPTGEIGLCEHYSESEFISSLDAPEQVDARVVSSFKELHPELDICNDCPVYPQCIRLKKCIERSACFAELKESRIESVRHSMQRSYEKWLQSGCKGIDSNGTADDDDMQMVVC